MNHNPNVFVNSAEEGLNKVKKGGFAYILGKKRNMKFKNLYTNNFANRINN